MCFAFYLLVQSLKYLLRFNVRTRPVRKNSVDDNAREVTADCFRSFRANIFPVVLGILDDPSLFEERLKWTNEQAAECGSAVALEVSAFMAQPRRERANNFQRQIYHCSL